MKRSFLILMVSMLLFQCGKAPILSATYSLTLPSSAGVSSNLNLTTFTSALASGITTLTFTDSDSDVLEFKINGLQSGNTYDMSTTTNSMTGSFTITDETGALTAVQVQNTTVGFLKVTGLTGSGSSITGMSGSFQLNIQIASSSNPTTTGTGTIIGNINFNH